ncbi:hypothetical protein HDU98_011128 [Podochytrium sp. JEL0797]|nr:hypothetical protein HDU98_011128 [Podochytrium sp. JEL0797]
MLRHAPPLFSRRSGFFLSQTRNLSLSQRQRRGESETWTKLQGGGGDAAWRVSHSHKNVLLDVVPGPAAKDAPRNALLLAARAAKDQLMVMFLPKGYPRSVSSDYLPYTTWHFAHSTLGTVTGTLSTQALLHALGLGAATSAGLAATTNWLIKDGFGLLGGVLYAGSVATKFDDQPKRFRFLSAGLIQLSCFLELLTPLLPHLFVPIASISNIGKNIGWLASSASRASIHRGFTLTDNLGDVTAKSGAQSTMAGLLGTVCGIGISYLIGYSDPITLMNVFVPLSVLNMACCYRSNHAVITKSLNVERGEIALEKYVKEVAAGRVGALRRSDGACVHNPNEIADSLILPLLNVSQRESFVLRYESVLGLNVLLEPSLVRHAESLEPRMLQRLFDGQDANQYRMMLSRKEVSYLAHHFGANRNVTEKEALKHVLPTDWRVCLWFLESSKSGDHFKAFYHSCIARRVFLDRVERMDARTLEDFGAVQREFQQAVLETRAVVEETFEDLVAVMHTSLADALLKGLSQQLRSFRSLLTSTLAKSATTGTAAAKTIDMAVFDFMKHEKVSFTQAVANMQATLPEGVALRVRYLDTKLNINSARLTRGGASEVAVLGEFDAYFEACFFLGVSMDADNLMAPLIRASKKLDPGR